RHMNTKLKCIALIHISYMLVIEYKLFFRLPSVLEACIKRSLFNSTCFAILLVGQLISSRKNFAAPPPKFIRVCSVCCVSLGRLDGTSQSDNPLPACFFHRSDGTVVCLPFVLVAPSPPRKVGVQPAANFKGGCSILSCRCCPFKTDPSSSNVVSYSC